MEAYKAIKKCRVGGTEDLVSVLDLGQQALTGVFPKDKSQAVTVGPLELVWCPSSGLLQLRHSYNAEEMYGDNYGYRSGLNGSMVKHLSEKVRQLKRLVDLQPNDVVLDIGSNDCTLLKAYDLDDIRRIGIDPTGKKFSDYYPAEVTLVPDFFSTEAFHSVEKQKARIITSIAMFYDLEQPIEFAKQIEQVLSEDGIWHFEQSYMPSMLRLNSYDTICHEHIEYYSLGVVEKILGSSGMKVIDVTMNSTNGGSFAVTAARADSTSFKVNSPVIDWMLEQEEQLGLHTPRPYRDFEERVFRHRDDLTRLIHALNNDGKTVLGYGASTKGNVMLQFCGLTSDDIPAIAEVNEEKFGRVTPGTHIPIISEAEARAMKPDYFLVLPWHFKEGIIQRESDFLLGGGKFIFPFPEIEII